MSCLVLHARRHSLTLLADRPVLRTAPGIAVRFIGVQHCAVNRNILINQLVAGSFIRVVTHPVAVFTALT
jgi:hypothetical protein